LQFASRAKTIVNNVQANQKEDGGSEVVKFKDEILRLKEQMAAEVELKSSTLE
jgi:hypothetical protein